MSKFKNGDTVVMHTCGEAELPKYHGKVWECNGDSFVNQSKVEVVFLFGFSGSFAAKYLQLVDLKNIAMIDINKLLQKRPKVDNYDLKPYGYISDLTLYVDELESALKTLRSTQSPELSITDVVKSGDDEDIIAEITYDFDKRTIETKDYRE